MLLSAERKRFIVKRAKTASREAPQPSADAPVRERVLNAAFSAFMERGYEGASTLDIATRAKVSKRELYTLFDDKQAMLAAGVTERAKRMRLPLELPAVGDRPALAAVLTAFGTSILRGVCESHVLAVYRLAIAESERSPGIAKVLDSAGREANHAALTACLAEAKARGLFADGDPSTMAACFFGLLWENLLIRLLLRVTHPPTIKEMERRAADASRALLALYPEPSGSEASA
jgi:AcrR family transcriptional regulator